MELFGKVIQVMDAQMKEPEMFGWFHLAFFALTFIAAYVMCRQYPKADEKTVRNLLLAASIVSIVLELYKQFNFSFTYDGSVVKYDYQWYSFPFQFCSTPMYAGLLAGLLRKGKVQNAICSYLATFSVFAGLCVMIYPPQVFVETIGINIQSMICHGSMITVGIYLLYTEYVRLEHKTILNAIPVFAVFVTIASVMNEIAYRSGLLERETFNMFFISPYCEPSLPVYSSVQAVVPYPLSAIIYVAVFSLAAYVILLLAMCVKTLAKKYRYIREKQKTVSV
ncbi:MAG: YwaF family protein [Clostridia bacterium]|nr:YwaF family protein [Clostridia bacterium]